MEAFLGHLVENISLKFKPSTYLRHILLATWSQYSSFELGFLNIFSRQNLLRNLSLVLFLLQRYKNGAIKCPKNHVRFNLGDDSTLANQKTGKTIEKTLKELPWNQQYTG